MVLSFITVRGVPRGGWGPRASPSVFSTSLGTLRMLMDGKSCLIPLLFTFILIVICPVVNTNMYVVVSFRLHFIVNVSKMTYLSCIQEIVIMPLAVIC